MLNLCWRPSRPKTDADDAGDAFDFPFRGLFQDHLTRGPKHRKNRCFLNPTRRIHRKLQHHQWPGGGSGVGRRLGGGCPITFGYQPKASGSATGPVGRRPDLRAAAPCRRPPKFLSWDPKESQGKLNENRYLMWTGVAEFSASVWRAARSNSRVHVHQFSASVWRAARSNVASRTYQKKAWNELVGPTLPRPA